MKPTRIIARLDIKGPNLVKGVHLEGLRVLGQPQDFAKHYYDNGIDELIYIDTVASLYGRNNLTDILEFTAKNVFVPVTAGGGLRSVEDIESILKSGADKVAINTAAVANPDLIDEAAKIFGSQCIVLYVEAKKIENEYFAFTDNAREISDRRVKEWVIEAQERGAGEILLTSVDQEGTGRGFDLELIETVKDNLHIPLIVGGGCGTKEHAVPALQEHGVDAIACASIFHYNQNLLNEANVKSTNEGVTEYFQKIQKNYVDAKHKRIEPCSVKELKEYLVASKIACRVTA